MFLGVSTLNLDAKGRLAVPAKYRNALAQSCASRVVVTINPDQRERCLLMYPENEWFVHDRAALTSERISSRRVPYSSASTSRAHMTMASSPW